MAELNVDNRTVFVGDNLPVLRGINLACARPPHAGGRLQQWHLDHRSCLQRERQDTRTWREIAIVPQQGYIGFRLPPLMPRDRLPHRMVSWAWSNDARCPQ